MQGSIALRNEVRSMPEAPPIEFIYNIQVIDEVEAVTTDLNLYFQKAAIYPAKALVAGILTPNVGNVYVGKSGAIVARALTSLVNFGSVARATFANHGFRQGMSITHTGATPGDYNVTKQIFNVTANTYDFQLAADPGGPATVLPTATRVQYTPDLLVPTDICVIYELPLGQKMRLADIVIQGHNLADGVFVQAW